MVSRSWRHQVSTLISGLAAGLFCSGLFFVSTGIAQDQEQEKAAEFLQPDHEAYCLALPSDDSVLINTTEQLLFWYGLSRDGELQTRAPAGFGSSGWTYFNLENVTTQFLIPRPGSPWFPKDWQEDPNRRLSLRTYGLLFMDTDPVEGAKMDTMLELRLFNSLQHRLAVQLKFMVQLPEEIDSREYSVHEVLGVSAIALRTWREAERGKELEPYYYIPVSLLSAWLREWHISGQPDESIQSKEPLPKQFLAKAEIAEKSVTLPKENAKHRGKHLPSYIENPSDLRALLSLAQFLEDQLYQPD